MATRRRYRKVKQTKRRYKRGGKQSKKQALQRAKTLHMAFGKQRALAFASH